MFDVRLPVELRVEEEAEPSHRLGFDVEPSIDVYGVGGYPTLLLHGIGTDTAHGVSSFTTTQATIERASLTMKDIVIRKRSFYSPDCAAKLSPRHPPRRTLSSASPIQKSGKVC
jgi:hypothetical protein